MSEDQKIAYQVDFESPAKKEPVDILSDFFNREAITGAKIAFDGAYHVLGITEEQAEKLGSSRGVSSCYPSDNQVLTLTLPGFKSC